MDRMRSFGFGVSSALALALAAYATPQETVTFNDVVTEGLLGSPLNGVTTHGFTGSYTVTKLRFSGTLTSTSAGTWPDDSRLQVTTPSGQIILVRPFTQIGGFTTVSTPSDVVVTLPTPEVAAGTWTFTYYESYDDTGSDAVWNVATFTLDDEAPPPPPPPADFQEVEPNDFKDQATPASEIAPGETIGGLTLGASTVTPGNTSADYFKIKTPAAALGIYRHRLVFANQSTSANVATIRGLTQTDGFINPGTDATVQTASVSTSPSNAVQWYGFGKEEELYVRVTGSGDTGTEYRGTYEVSTVTPIEAGSFIQGEITIAREPGNTVDSDFLVYDGSLNAIAGYSNDGGDTLTRVYEPGTYYIAFSNFNTCNDQPAPPDDTYPNENVMDFPHVAVNNGTGTIANMNIQITDVTGSPVSVTGSKDGFFDIVWYKMVVAEPTGPIDPRGNGAATPASAQITGDVLLTVQVFGGLNPPSTGLQVRGDLTALNGGTNQIFYDDGTNGDVTPGDMVFSRLATLAEPMTAGPVAVPFVVTDAESRDGTGTINFTATAAPSGGCCLSDGCQTLSAYACAQAGGSYTGNGSSCEIAPSGSVYSSIAGTGTMLTAISSCDDCTESLGLPFTFNFYGADYSSINVSSNGNVQFTGVSTEYFNNTIPSAGSINNAIYPLWDDLNPLTQGDVFYQVDGVSPNQTLTIEWYNCSQYTGGGAWPVTSESFQLVLFEGSNNIEFRYGDISPASTTGVNQGSGVGPGGDDYTVGIENSDGTAAAWVPGTSLGSGNVSLLLNSNSPVVTCSSCTGQAGTCGSQDFNGDGDFGTDQDIEAFFACIAGSCCSSCFCGGQDFNGDGDFGTDQDIEAFFRVIAGGTC